MNALQAYPDGRTYEQRLATKYAVGDRVIIGPAYVTATSYRADDLTGSVGTIFARDRTATEIYEYDVTINGRNYFMYASRFTMAHNSQG